MLAIQGKSDLAIFLANMGQGTLAMIGESEYKKFTEALGLAILSALSESDTYIPFVVIYDETGHVQAVIAQAGKNDQAIFKDLRGLAMTANLGEAEFKTFIEALGLVITAIHNRSDLQSMLESLGQGIMLTYGSYMRPHDDIPRTAIVVGFMTVLVAVLASLTIFPIVFTFHMPPQAGPGLVFKTLPILFAKLPGALLISTIFFTLFTFTALTSAIALIEVVSANFMDLLGWSRHRAVLIVGAACLICGIPSALSNTGLLFGNWEVMYGKTFFATLNDLVSFWMIPIGGVMIALYTGWVLDRALVREEFERGTWLKWLWRPWLFFMRWIIPVAISIIVFQKTGLINLDAWFQK
jgi:SNF family Na+-dependent transporter